MKKLILLLILVSILCIQLEAKKKKADYIKYISGLYLNNDGDKKIGDVYILTRVC